MTRTLRVLALILATALAFGFAPAAHAQDDQAQDDQAQDDQGDDAQDDAGAADEDESVPQGAAQSAYPGPFSDLEAEPDATTNRGVHFIEVQANAADDGDDSDGDDDDDDGAVGGTGGGDASTDLAATGSDVEPIVAVSIGLLAVGGSALVSSRRRVRDLFS